MGLVGVDGEKVEKGSGEVPRHAFPCRRLLFPEAAGRGKNQDAVIFDFRDAGTVAVKEAGDGDVGFSGRGDESDATVGHGDEALYFGPGEGVGAGADHSGDAFVSNADLAGLPPESQRVNQESALNGIAYDVEHDRIFVTGKQWPAVFEIRVTSRAKLADNVDRKPHGQ